MADHGHHVFLHLFSGCLPIASVAAELLASLSTLCPPGSQTQRLGLVALLLCLCPSLLDYSLLLANIIYCIVHITVDSFISLILAPMYLLNRPGSILCFQQPRTAQESVKYCTLLMGIFKDFLTPHAILTELTAATSSILVMVILVISKGTAVSFP